MSNIKLIIEERAANIDKFIVEGLLPFRYTEKVNSFINRDIMYIGNLIKQASIDVSVNLNSVVLDSKSTE